jgi:hypothetical protein
MRRSDRIILSAVLLCLSFGPAAADALDLKTPADSAPVLPGVGPVGVHFPAPCFPTERGDDTCFDINGGVKTLENAFRSGDVLAGWKLGCMYAYGLDGVQKDPARAFEIFRAIVESQRGAVPAGRSKSFIADAMVMIGRYYLTGIPNSSIEADPVRAFAQFNAAAINYGSAEGQYLLGLAYLDGQGTDKNPALALKWFFEAAGKDHFEAQALVGRLLVQGIDQVIPRDVPLGLMWLKIAAHTAPKGGPFWIEEWSDSAWTHATESERAAAMILIEKRMARGASP